jgi:hypothetical protein
MEINKSRDLWALMRTEPTRQVAGVTACFRLYTLSHSLERERED